MLLKLFQLASLSMLILEPKLCGLGQLLGSEKTTYMVSDFAGDLKIDREYLISWKSKTNTSTNEWYLMDKVHANAFEAFGIYLPETRS